jgi:NAD(P)H-hydrate epimerase
MTLRDERGFEFLARAAEVREMDRRTIQDLGIPSLCLMELAGAGAAQAIRDRTGGEPGRVVVVCGQGHNGGDGYVIARHLQDAGWTVRCIALDEPAGLRGDAAHNHRLWAALGGEVKVMRERTTARMRHHLGHAEVIVDALFGTGLARPLQGPALELVEAANEASFGLRVAVDLPSGVAADTGQILGAGFRADLTCTFGVAKPGLFQGPGAALAGEVRVVPIGLPRQVVRDVGASARLADERAVAAWIPARPTAGHKGHFGHVGVVGGSPGMEGAAALACTGAHRGGAGLVTWIGPDPPHAVERLPETMHHPFSSGLDPRPTVLVVGPGLGPARDILAAVLADPRPRVLDADALNLIAAEALAVPPGSLLTPHPGEAARLLGTTVARVQADRLGAASELAGKTESTVILKGNGTCVAAPGEPIMVIPRGDPTLAAGGSGDVLAGLVGALVAQGLEAYRAAVVGAFVHAVAGERAGRTRGQRGVLAREVAEVVPTIMGELAQGWVA